MTLTSHAHHIPGTPVESFSVQAFNCGGPGVCESCTFETRWVQDYANKRAIILPSDVDDSFDAQILRKIAAKLRSQNPKPKTSILVREQLLSRIIHSLADAIDGVADDI